MRKKKPLSMEIVFLFPTVFILFLIAAYHRNRKQAEREVEWEKDKAKYKYKDWRY